MGGDGRQDGGGSYWRGLGGRRQAGGDCSQDSGGSYWPGLGGRRLVGEDGGQDGGGLIGADSSNVLTENMYFIKRLAIGLFKTSCQLLPTL